MLIEFLWSLSVSIASSQQNIIKFEHVFVAYITTRLLRNCCLRTTHLLFCTFSLISSRRRKSTKVTPNISRHKIRPIILNIWSHENFKLKYFRIKFYCFFSFHFDLMCPRQYSYCYGNDARLFSKIWIHIPWNNRRFVRLNHKPW